jgi:hypothetical protein
MLDLVARLLVALTVAAGAAGIGTAQDHASPGGSANAIAAIEAIIARVSAAAHDPQAPTTQAPEATGLDRATDVANDHAAAGLEKAKAVSGDAAGAAPAEAPDVDAPPVAAPPVDVPPAHGPPATHPPVPAPPVPAPPVDAPGQGNRP